MLVKEGTGVLFGTSTAVGTNFKNVVIVNPASNTNQLATTWGGNFEQCLFSLGNAYTGIITFSGTMVKCFAYRGVNSTSYMFGISATASCIDCVFDGGSGLRTPLVQGSSSGPLFDRCIFKNGSDAIAMDNYPVRVLHCIFDRCNNAIVFAQASNNNRSYISDNLFIRLSGYAIKSVADDFGYFPLVRHNIGFQLTAGFAGGVYIDDTNEIITKDPFPDLLSNNIYALDPLSGIINKHKGEVSILDVPIAKYEITPGAVQPKTPGLSRSRILGGV
jgi:hypothetical protein